MPLGGIRHVVLSCSHTSLARMAVTDCVKSHAMKDPLLSSLTSGQDAQSIRLASFNGCLSSRPMEAARCGALQHSCGFGSPYVGEGIFTSLVGLWHCTVSQTTVSLPAYCIYHSSVLFLP